MKKLIYLIPLLAFIPSVALGAVSFVQSTSTDCGKVTQCTITFGSPTTAGDFFVVSSWIVAQNRTVTVTSTQGDSFSNAFKIEAPTTAETGIYYAPNVGGGTTSLSVSISGAAAFMDFIIAEYSGVAASNPLDKVSTSTATSAHPTTGSVTTSNANELLVSIAGSNDNGENINSVGTPWTFDRSQLCINVGKCLADAYLVATSTLTTSSTFTMSQSAVEAAGLATFNAATSSPANSTSSDELSISSGNLQISGGNLSIQ